MKIGLIGTGRLGGGMVERLINVGHEVYIWNRSPEKAQHLVKLGANLMATPAMVAEATEVILSVLTDASAIDAVYSGPSGILSVNLQGKVCIDMSTVRPETQIALAAKVIAAGGEFVEFDDCTKLNNNKEAQNGGCSTGASDNVVKLRKTKSNVNAPSLGKKQGE